MTTHRQLPDEHKQQNQYEREHTALVSECHNLVLLISQKPYAIKRLRAVREGLLMNLNYKGNRYQQNGGGR